MKIVGKKEVSGSRRQSQAVAGSRRQSCWMCSVVVWGSPGVVLESFWGCAGVIVKSF